MPHCYGCNLLYGGMGCYVEGCWDGEFELSAGIIFGIWAAKSGLENLWKLEAIN
jgi:hypothetical protein